MKSWKNFIRLILISSIFISTLTVFHPNFISNTVNNNDPIKTKGLDLPKKADFLDSPINILANWSATETAYTWCSGKGTSEEPYIIENLTIDAAGYSYAIRIVNSMDYFIIRNCTIYNSLNIGIGGQNIGNGTFTNNTIYNTQGDAIQIGTAMNITISNNTIYNTQGKAIQIGNAMNITISNNTIYSTDSGIYITYTLNITISNNTIEFVNDGTGIELTDCNIFTIYHNVIRYNAESAIIVKTTQSGADINANNNIITLNEIYDNGWDSIVIEINLEESKLIFQNTLLSNNDIYNNEDDGLQLEFYLDNSEVQLENNSICNNIIHGNNGDGVAINLNINGISNLTFQHNNISNNIIYENGYYGEDEDEGIGMNINAELEDDSMFIFKYNNISNNQIFSNRRSGIEISADLEGTSKAQLENNLISNNEIHVNGFGDYYEDKGVGINLDTELGDYSNCIIGYNQIVRNNISQTADEGISFILELNELTRMDFCFNNISENTLGNIGYDGISIVGIIEVEGSDGEIYIFNNTIAKNTIKDMMSDGIALYFADYEDHNVDFYLENNSVINNKITRNLYYGQAGIYLDRFYNTTFLNNEMNNCGLLIVPGPPDLNKLLTFNVINNKVNGKSLTYKTNLKDLSSEDFMDSGQIILINCNYSIISNLNVSKATIGICLYHCNNITIFKVNSTDGTGGFLLSYSNENNITTNIANDNRLFGIYLYRSNYSLIENNNFLGTIYCIYEFDCIGNVKVNNQCPPSEEEDDGGGGEDGVQPPIIHGFNLLIGLLISFITIVAISIIFLRKRIRKL